MMRTIIVELRLDVKYWQRHFLKRRVVCYISVKKRLIKRLTNGRSANDALIYKLYLYTVGCVISSEENEHWNTYETSDGARWNKVTLFKETNNGVS